MPRLTARQRLGLQNVMKGKSTLVVCCPCYQEWADKLASQSEERGVCDLELLCEGVNRVRDLVSLLEAKVEAGAEYSTVVLVPGHGNEATYMKKVKGKSEKEEVRSTPYMVWHRKGDQRTGDVLIQGARLKKVIRLCVDLAKHVHLGTCYQGCMLDLYRERLHEDQLAREPPPTLSGWRKGLMQDDAGEELIRYILRGCPTRRYRWGARGSRTDFAYVPY